MVDLSFDVSFKRTLGDLNEWKAAGFDIIFQRREFPARFSHGLELMIYSRAHRYDSLLRPCYQ